MYNNPSGKGLGHADYIKHLKKGIIFSARMTYTMSPDVKYEFNTEDYPA